MDLPPESSSAKDSTPQTTTDPARAAALFEQSVAIMARLRAPGGCPWDREQSFDSIRKYTLEEAYEVFDAIERRDFTFVGRTRRSASAGPVLCGDGGQRRPLHDRGCSRPAESQTDSPPSACLWRRSFARRRKPGRCGRRCRRFVSCRAAQLGRDQGRGKTGCGKAGMQQTRRRRESNRHRGSTAFCARCPRWLKPPSSAPRRRNPASTGRAGATCCPKSPKRPRSLRAEAASDETDSIAARKPAVEAELGDLLFTVVNLGRHLGVDAEMALRNCNLRFRRRFREMELAAPRPLEDLSPPELEALWAQAKKKLARRCAQPDGRNKTIGAKMDNVAHETRARCANRTAKMIEIRTCEGFDELEACVQLQIETWGYDENDVIPRKTFHACAKNRRPGDWRL